MRIGEGSIKLARNGGYIHKLDGQLAPNSLIKQTTERRLTDKEMHAKWSRIARRCYSDGERRVRELAEALGVAYWALDALQVGYGECADTWCWTFPERNQDGLVVGISRRFKDGTKRSATESRRGLTYCDAWKHYDGPVFLVEGGSDVAACLTLRLSVIGRPSNVGGVPMLVKMLEPIDKTRRIVVIGERDYRELPPNAKPPHNPKCKCCRRCYPGKQGAMDVAAQLRKRLRRRVEWGLPPDGAKDMREYVRQLGLPLNEHAMAEAGRKVWQ
jgi:hypothetical protein